MSRRLEIAVGLALVTVLQVVLSQVVYDVTCTDKVMKVTITVSSNQSNVFLERLKDFPGCGPKTMAGKSVFKLPLENFHECGTTKMTNKYTGQTIYYNRIIIDQLNQPREVLLVKCVLPGEKTKPMLWEKKRPKRNVLPDGFFEYEELNITNIVAHAPTPYLNLAIRQNGRILDTSYNVQPGTPLEMLIYLDEKSASVYGLLSSYLKVTDDTPDHDEIIVMNGCSIDPYIFGNFETNDAGKSLFSKFRAFKFPDSNYVLFVGTVNVCLKECRGVPCGNGQLGYGRKKREIPAEMPFDPNKLYEVEMATVIKVQFPPNHFKPQRGSIEGNFEGIKTNDDAETTEGTETNEDLKTNELAAFTQHRINTAVSVSPSIVLLRLVISMALLHYLVRRH